MRSTSALEHDLDQAFRAVRRLLRQPADAPARRHLDVAVLGGDVAGDDVEQRALAAAVAADEPDAGAVRNADRGVLDQQPAGDADGKIVDDEHARSLAEGRRDAIPNQPAAQLRHGASASDAVRAGGREPRPPRAKEADHVCSRMPGSGATPRSAVVGSSRALPPPALPPARSRRPRPRRGPSAAPRTFKAVVDLTHTMSPEFPTFFGVPGIELQKQFDFKKDGFNLNWWRIIEHAGTHLDAPIHFSENGATVEKIVAGELVVPLAVIDVRKQAGEESGLSADASRTSRLWEKKFGRLPDNCCVAMMSGWAQHVGDAAKFTGKDAGGTFHFPGFSPRGGRMAAEGAQGAGTRGRYAVARQRRVEGLQDPPASGCRPAAGAWRTSPTSKRCRRPARRWWWGWPR